MGQDTIRAIRNAEQKAEQMEKEAASACAAMIADAKNRAKAEGDAMLLAVKEENARLIAAAKEAELDFAVDVYPFYGSDADAAPLYR